jgi:hypothetical protein
MEFVVHPKNLTYSAVSKILLPKPDRLCVGGGTAISFKKRKLYGNSMCCKKPE